jgi:hypothetical protein
MQKIAVNTRQKPFLAFLKHRRWWQFNINPPGPQGTFVTENLASRFVTEDGLYLFVTEA